jgi:hypothetical protein
VLIDCVEAGAAAGSQAGKAATLMRKAEAAARELGKSL